MALAAKKFYGRSPGYPLVQALYRRAFPPRERIPGIALRWMAAYGHLDALAFWEKKKFCGFAYLAVQEKTVFIVYLAVDDRLRGQGYGSQILNCIKALYPGRTIILDVEKADDSADNARQRRRRIEFYQRNGFYETDQTFAMRGVRYRIMSTKADFAEKDYKAFWQNVGRKKT